MNPRPFAATLALKRIFACQIRKPREAVVEEEFDTVGGAMAVLFDQDFRAAVRAFAFVEPLRMIR